MIEPTAAPTPTRKPIEQGWIDKQDKETLKSYREREESRREEKRARHAEIDARYDPNVNVVIEYINPARETLISPLVWKIGENYFGFWKEPRPAKGLLAWQELVPASHGLPKCDAAPHAWKLIFDPRIPTTQEGPLSEQPAETQPETEQPDTEPSETEHSEPAEEVASETQPETEQGPEMTTRRRKSKN